ncbi:hypothetical protein CHLNCDRAFT_133380 [Chlorella variabilis]|uniref:J domain-containing protein n=1 Tax=Chlorella variabilis TaxID=554065 RepID=E1Z2Z5_CHLVA|nr:hypothetical protein CHLNCDRAFT_133380 [Chlorella variabilis]EFN60079.1 hypothetical protein CHLNCDRAFT_133380 [Chlorella variabilis]|eukprot:XP_005852181.1 hypothetical protein CHLNCDRAFT_133380 [Chlorella variabilis]
MAEMKAKAEQQRVAEEAREGERRQREGAAYQTPEQRAEAARAARQAAAEGRAEREEARVAEKRFDPARDYYQLLGIPRGASAADVRRTYKRLALLYHPDKHKAEGVEQQAAIQEKFKQARGGAST